MISRFFIDRPIFAAVLSILIFSAGMVAIAMLPVDRFPQITPPTVSITAFYPGANAQTVAESIAVPIEQELSGAKHLLYYQSYAANDGSLRITATFEVGTDVDLAAVELQNRLKAAEPRLPQEAVRQGITVRQAGNNILFVAGLNSTNPQHDSLFLSNYAKINMIDALKRVPGVGDAQVAGSQDYAMRIWVNPDLLSSKNMTIVDVANAVREQNGLYAAGRIGAAPAPAGVELTVPVVTSGRLQTVEEFENIILRAEDNGTFLYLKDVARVELSSQGFDVVSRQDGEPTTVILLYLQSGANALEVTTSVIETLDDLSEDFPEGVSYQIPYDTTPFIRVAVQEVIHTFAEAMGLVTLVVLLFLGTWRGTIIPLLAVPVAIIGTFMGMLLLGFSINSLTLFGLVLAIGIVVDDAIIVVENVERIMHEEHLPVREATIRAMEQVSGPVIAIVLVLSSVFIPVGFMGGLTGELYRQFAVTIAISVIISGVVALTLSPALCAVLLKKGAEKKLFIFRWFDWWFEKMTRLYTWSVRFSIRFGVITLILFGLMMYATAELYKRVPSGFIPQEDQGYFIVAVMLPPGSSVDRTSEVIKQVEDFVLSQPEVNHAVALAGIDLMSGFTPSTSAGIMFVNLKDWSERPGKDQHVDAIIGRVFGRFAGMKEAFVLPLNPPPVNGLGLRAGFEYQLEARGGGSIEELVGVMNDFVAAAGNRPEVARVNGGLNIGTPQLHIELDNERTKLRGVSISDVYTSLQALLGSLYVNDFVKYGRVFRVQLGADAIFRDSPEDIQQLYVRNNEGEMVPMSDLVKTSFIAGPNVVSRFNGFPAVQITGETAPGMSSGDAIRAIEELSSEILPQGYSFEWSGASFQEIRAGNQAPYVIALGLFVVFLVLCALYERWSLPIAVLLSIPAAAFGALLAIYLRQIPRDIYFQIGALTLIGLAAKNAILIVEFASELRKSGLSVTEAAIEAARVRLRPFVMTSLAFILGVTPLAFAHGAGAAGRQSIGTGVMGGMIAATFIGMFFIPLLFVIVEKSSDFIMRRKDVPVAKPATIETEEGAS